MNAIVTLTWSIWQRNSRWLIAITAYFVIFATVLAPFCRPDRPQAVFAIASLLLIFCYLALVGIFMFQDTDVGVRGSAYPVSMMTLPVRTFKLVFLPMFLGTVTFLGSGLIISRVLHGYFADFPLYWPAVMVTAILAMLQALFWYPLGVPYSKLVLTLIGIPGMVYLVSWSLESSLSEAFVCKCLAVLTVLCYAIAYHGVVRARRGEIQMFTVNFPSVDLGSNRAVKWLTFKDKDAAQRWYEWKQQGLVLPVMVLFVCILFYIPIIWNSTESPVYALGERQKTVPMISTFIYTYFPLIFVAVPIVALIVGCGARRTDIKHADRTFHLFFGTRPMTDSALVAQKLWLALKSSLVSWAIVGVLLLTFLPMPGTLYHADTQLISQEKIPIFTLLQPYLTPDLLLWTFCAMSLFIVGTWRNYAIGFWTELSGKTWLRYGYPITMLALIFGVPSALGQIRREGIEQVYWTVLVLVWSLIVFRIATIVVLTKRHLANGVLTPRTLQRGIMTYLAGYAVLIPMAYYCTRSFRSSLTEYIYHFEVAATMLIIGLTILWIPIVRILLATEMLHQNRHRAN